MVLQENGIRTNPWPFQTELTLCDENANHPSQTQPLQMCESEFAVKLVPDGGIQLQFFSSSVYHGHYRHRFPFFFSFFAVRAAEAKEGALQGLIQNISLTSGTPVSALVEHILNHPQCFMIIIFRVYFSHHYPQFTSGFPLLDLLKPCDSPSKILITAICLFLLIVTRKIYGI